MKGLFVLMLMALLLVGCSSEPETPPFKVDTYNKINDFNVPYVQVEITATVDHLTVTDAIVNRGNCTLGKNPFIKKSFLPAELKYGESIQLFFGTPCKASQLDVVTDQGEWTITY